MKCLLSLFDMYDMARRSKGVMKNEAEFRSYYVLLHLGCKIPTMVDLLTLHILLLYHVDENVAMMRGYS